MRRCWGVGVVAAAVAGLFAGASAFGSNVTYTVDPTRSWLTISGSYQSLPIGPQGIMYIQVDSGGPPSPDSLTAFYTGTITAERDTILDTLRITGGSVAAEDNGSWPPPVNVPPTANYGTVVSTHSLPGFDLLGAVHNFSFSTASPLISAPSNFDASVISALITSGQFDFEVIRYTEAVPSAATDGYAALGGSLPFAGGSGTLVDADGIETLTIPIDTDLVFMVDGQPLFMHLSGNVVATTPEPRSLILLGAPAFLFLVHRRRGWFGAGVRSTGWVRQA